MKESISVLLLGLLIKIPAIIALGMLLAIGFHLGNRIIRKIDAKIATKEALKEMQEADKLAAH